mgnify:CR=1 FL=1
MSKISKNNSGPLPSPKNKAQYVKLVKKGQTFYNRGNYNQALRYFTRSWDYDAKNLPIIKMVAECLFQLGNRNVAIQLLAYVLEKNPNDPVVITILGNAALKMELFDLAQKFHQIYIQLLPQDPIGYNNYASALREDGKLDEAITFLQDILPMFPEEEILWNTLGSIVSFRDGGAASIVFYEECLRINPKNVFALNNIAPAYVTVNEIEKAEKAIRKGIDLNPTLAKLHLFLFGLLLDTKRLEEGWKEYQWRKDGGNILGTIAYNKIPEWRGEDLTGKKIFIFGEQGVGDEILFSWLFNEIIEEADKVGIACTKRLIPLFKNSFKNAEITEYSDKFDSKLDFELKMFPDTDLSQYDYMCCSGDLSMYKWSKNEDIKPSSAPILKPSEDKIAHWKERLDELPHDISIGISWRSGIKHAKRARNYTSLLNWEPVLKLKNVNFINLQYGDCTEELDELEKKTGIKIHNFDDLDLKNDFDGTTALIKNCDVVIGPGSAPIMQSAMAGVETWFLLTANPWWRFGNETPIWRQNAKLLTKSDNAPWEELMQDCSVKLKKWIKAKK